MTDDKSAPAEPPQAGTAPHKYVDDGTGTACKSCGAPDFEHAASGAAPAEPLTDLIERVIDEAEDWDFADGTFINRQTLRQSMRKHFGAQLATQQAALREFANMLDQTVRQAREDGGKAIWLDVVESWARKARLLAEPGDGQ